jgi:predicted DNA-binding transcriptional regulator AlpA
MRQFVIISHVVIESDMPTLIEPPMTSRDVSQLLNVSPRTLHRWGRLKKGPPSIKVGRSVLYRRAAIEGWLLSLERDGDDGATVARKRR